MYDVFSLVIDSSMYITSVERRKERDIFILLVYDKCITYPGGKITQLSVRFSGLNEQCQPAI